MKIKNIIFSGAMASILMVGGAYADIVKVGATSNPVGTSAKLTTEQYVRGGVKEAEDYADQQVAALVNGAVATNAEAISTLNGDGVGSVSKSIADALAEAGLTGEEGTTIDDRLTAAERDIDNLETKVGSDTLVAGEADTIVQAVNANYSAIETLTGADTVAGSVAKAEKDAKAYTDTKIGELNVGTLSASGSGVAVSLSETDGKIGNLTASIEDAGVTGAKIADKAVTNAKLSDAVNASLAKADAAAAAADLKALAKKDTVATDDIDNLAVTGAKIANNTITSDKIASSDLATSWTLVTNP